MKAFALTLACALVLLGCETAKTVVIAGDTFDFPPDLAVDLPSGNPDPPFDTDRAVSVTMANRDGLLKYVSPLGYSDLPAIDIIDIKHITLLGPENLNDPELGFNYRESETSEIKGTRKFEHIGENYRLLNYYDSKNRIKYQCSPGSPITGSCHGSIYLDRLVIQYRFDFEHLSHAPDIDAHLAMLVRSWIVEEPAS